MHSKTSSYSSDMVSVLHLRLVAFFIAAQGYRRAVDWQQDDNEICWWRSREYKCRDTNPSYTPPRRSCSATILRMRIALLTWKIGIALLPRPSVRRTPLWQCWWATKVCLPALLTAYTLCHNGVLACR